MIPESPGEWQDVGLKCDGTWMGGANALGGEARKFTGTGWGHWILKGKDRNGCSGVVAGNRCRYPIRHAEPVHTFPASIHSIVWRIGIHSYLNVNTHRYLNSPE